jgi:flagellar biosynthesis/type III secretory pathway protein FliH
MNRDDVVRMAREVWGQTAVLPFAELERFAALVADAARGDYHEGFEEGYKAGAVLERHFCADIADQHASVEGIAQRIAAAIRARGES